MSATTPPAAPPGDATVPTGGPPGPPQSDATLPTAGPPSPHLGVNPRDLQGKPFGRYRLLRELGHGGMGVVWEAWDPQLQRSVALKQVLTHGVPDQAQIDRFVREARLAARLHHPGIVGVHEAGVWNGALYFTCDYVQGETLEQRMERPVEPRQAAEWVKAVAEALDYAHREGVIHRDVKPGNILLDERQQPHVGDFGLAREIAGERATSTPTLTVAGSLLGTPRYMSPEQASGRNADISAASDQFALGAVLYELIAGRPPFEGAGIQEILAAVCESDPDAPRSSRPALHRDLETICLKALEKDPSRRYPSMGALAEDLGHYLAGDPIGARRASILGVVTRRAARHPVMIGVALAAAAVIAVLVLWAVNSHAKVEQSRRVAQRAQADRDAVQELSRKSALVQAVLANWIDRTEDVEAIERIRFDSTLTDAQRAEAAREPMSHFEAFLQATPPDPASQSTARALVGWASVVRGDEAGVAAMREAAALDPDVPYGPLTEGLMWSSRYLGEFQPGFNADRGGLHLTAATTETDRAREYRKRAEECLARAGEARAWGIGLGDDARKVAGAIRDTGKEEYAEADRVLSTIAEAATLRPFRHDLLLARARARFGLKRFADCAADLEKIVRITPKHAESWLLLGWAWIGQGADAKIHHQGARDPFARAAESLDKAIALNPSTVTAHVLRAVARDESGQIALALADLDDALAKEGVPQCAWAYRAHLRMKTGNAAGAIEDFTKALAVDPGDVDSLASRAALIGQSGRLAEAKVDLDRAVKMDPSNLSARGNRATLRAMLGDLDGAIEDVQELLRLAPAEWSGRPMAERELKFLQEKQGH